MAAVIPTSTNRVGGTSLSRNTVTEQLNMNICDNNSLKMVSVVRESIKGQHVVSLRLLQSES